MRRTVLALQTPGTWPAHPVPSACSGPPGQQESGVSQGDMNVISRLPGDTDMLQSAWQLNRYQDFSFLLENILTLITGTPCYLLDVQPLHHCATTSPRSPAVAARALLRVPPVIIDCSSLFNPNHTRQHAEAEAGGGA